LNIRSSPINIVDIFEDVRAKWASNLDGRTCPGVTGSGIAASGMYFEEGAFDLKELLKKYAYVAYYTVLYHV
jgi:hypothetical protein